MPKLHIFLADDHAVVREGLKRLIETESDMTVIGEADNGNDAVARVVEMKPDVVVLDVSMPDLNGVEVTRRLRTLSPDIKILILTVHEDKSYSRELLELGVLGYVLKRAAGDELISAIRKVAAGGMHIDPRITDTLMTAMFSPAQQSEAAVEKLSERELAVLQLIARGYSNKEIAAQLELSVKTIETYKARSMEKLGLRSRVDIVRYANKQGWLIE